MRPIGSPSNPSVFHGVPGTAVFGHGAASPALFASDAVPSGQRILSLAGHAEAKSMTDSYVDFAARSRNAFRTAFMRVCQPGPCARYHANTSASTRSAICSLRAGNGRPRCATAPTQSSADVRGASAVNGMSASLHRAHPRPVRLALSACGSAGTTLALHDFPPFVPRSDGGCRLACQLLLAWPCYHEGRCSNIGCATVSDLRALLNVFCVDVNKLNIRDR